MESVLAIVDRTQGERTSLKLPEILTALSQWTEKNEKVPEELIRKFH